MELVVSLVHEKAIKEPLYSQCYARLTQFLSQEVSLFSQNLYLKQKKRKKKKKKRILDTERLRKLRTNNAISIESEVASIY